MELRNRLLFYFVFLVVIILIIFGLSAYQVTRDSAIKKDKDLLESLVKIEANEIAAEYHKSHSLEHLFSHFTEQRSDEHLWLLIDRNNRAINLENNDKHLIARAPDFSFEEMVASTENAGIIQFNNQDYIWAKSRLKGTEYTAVHIYTPIYDAGDYFARLATRLIVVAIIILWVAVWASLVISTVITRRIKEQQEKLEYQSNYDIVTGLQNRSFLTKKIEAIIQAKAITSLAVIIIGIDRFREINDTLGHEFGDQLLKEFGKRLKEEFWTNDTIARFGSDEYALLVPLSDHSHWEIVIYKIEKILNQSFMIQDIQIITDVSIGISIFPDHGATAAKLLKNAEIAMFMAKKTGSFYECYDPEKDPNSVDRLQLISELRHAIERNEFELYFQPKVDIHKHQLVSCEALLRWKNGKRGMVPPDVFIPLAEQGSSIRSLTEWVLDEAIKQCANWHKAGRQISIAVNLSARLLIESELIAMVSRVLSRYELDAEYLTLEITESAIMMDPVRALGMMNNLRRMGVHLSIDDFGTGYTSISQMKNLPVSEIKIDKSFILSMLKESGDASLVKLIIDMAHGMGHTVVAEGIEEQAVLNELNEMGCDIAQGYYLGRPMPVADFDAYQLDEAKRALNGQISLSVRLS